MKRVNINAATTELSRLIEEACAGEEIVISRGDVPMVRLVPVVPTQRARRFGSMKGRATVSDAFFEPLPS